MELMIIFAIASILTLFLVIYRSNAGDQVYQYVSYQGKALYSKVAPFTYKEIRKKIQDLSSCKFHNSISCINLNLFKYKFTINFLTS